MTLPFSHDQFLEVFARYNEAFWPVAVGLWIATAAALVEILRRDGGGRFVGTVLAITWAWSGIVYHAWYFTRINPAAWLFGMLFIAEAVLIAWYAVLDRRLRFRRSGAPRRVLGLALAAYALAYPGVVTLEGLVFPRAPTFGVPCPTVIATIGFFIAAEDPVPFALAIVPILWSLLGGSAAFVLGVRADLVLFAAGIAYALWLTLRTAGRRWAAS